MTSYAHHLGTHQGMSVVGHMTPANDESATALQRMGEHARLIFMVRIFKHGEHPAVYSSPLIYTYHQLGWHIQVEYWFDRHNDSDIFRK